MFDVASDSRGKPETLNLFLRRPAKVKGTTKILVAMMAGRAAAKTFCVKTFCCNSHAI